MNQSIYNLIAKHGSLETFIKINNVVKFPSYKKQNKFNNQIKVFIQEERRDILSYILNHKTISSINYDNIKLIVKSKLYDILDDIIIHSNNDIFNYIIYYGYIFKNIYIIKKYHDNITNFIENIFKTGGDNIIYKHTGFELQRAIKQSFIVKYEGLSFMNVYKYLSKADIISVFYCDYCYINKFPKFLMLDAWCVLDKRDKCYNYVIYWLFVISNIKLTNDINKLIFRKLIDMIYRFL